MKGEQELVRLSRGNLKTTSALVEAAEKAFGRFQTAVLHVSDVSARGSVKIDVPHLCFCFARCANDICGRIDLDSLFSPDRQSTMLVRTCGTKPCSSGSLPQLG